MKPFRFVHTADLHLDSPFRGLAEIAPELKEPLQEATFSAFRQIVDLCLARQVDGLLIAGDLHDAADRSLRCLTRLREQFHRLADSQISVFICHGNHDPLTEWEAKFSWPENVHVFGSREVESVPLLRGGVELARVAGISYGTEQVTENLAKNFKKDPNGPWCIGLLHTNVGGDQNHLNYAPCDLPDLLRTGMDYWALGHIHAHRVLHLGSPVIIYPGNPQGRNPRETGPRGCYVVEVDERGIVRYEFVPVDVVRWHQENLSIEGLQHPDDLLTTMEDRIEAIRHESANRCGIIRWKLTGRGSLHKELARSGRQEDLLGTLRERSGTDPSFMWSESIQDLTGREVDIEILRQEENLLGDYLRLSAAPDPSLLEELQASLKTLLEDARLRRYLEVPDEEGLRQLIHAAEQQGIDRLLSDDE